MGGTYSANADGALKRLLSRYREATIAMHTISTKPAFSPDPEAQKKILDHRAAIQRDFENSERLLMELVERRARSHAA